ncbi:MAG: penicillin-binding protein 2 [Ruminococcaceae bacterium]|nr:penicillin-binding protein 2 [Oscillospiraceae bacterium]
MKLKRVFAVCEGAAVLFSGLVCTCALAAANNSYAEASAQQSLYSLQINSGRGNFYDKNFVQLTGEDTKPYALLEPNSQTYRTLFANVAPDEKSDFYRLIQGTRPFLMQLSDIEKLDVKTVDKIVRYRPVAIASHLIGYVNSNEEGVSGLEKECDDKLAGSYTALNAVGTADANGNVIGDTKTRATYGDGTGIMLTLDATTQRICEGVAAQYMQSGSIVVLDAKSARVLTSVSVPNFDPSDIASATEETCFINRSISAYSVGSVFKPLLAAAALESGIDPEEPYECTGSIEVGGHTYRCAYGKGHGEVNLQTALEQSCNCYFVQLGDKLGGDTILKYATRSGFAQSTQIYGTMRTAKGTLPTSEQLEDKGELAMISFGQGKLTATPVQIAAMFNVFANDGIYISPTFVEGEVNAYARTVEKSLYLPIMRRVMHKNTASAVKTLMEGVVENGLGKNAAPARFTAGGKTGTAQTGRYDDDGSEIMNAWFAGFYPAEAPKYTIAVMLDSSTADSDEASKIFSQVATQLGYFLPK